jgi:hypothetical protein
MQPYRLHALQWNMQPYRLGYSLANMVACSIVNFGLSAIVSEY